MKRTCAACKEGMLVPISVDDVWCELRTALTGVPDSPLVLIGNFEVEDVWGAGEPGLPRIAMNSTRAIVNRMDELALPLGGSGDAVVLKEIPDPDFLEYLSELGLPLPRVLAPREQHPHRTVTEDALADPELIASLTALASSGAHLWAHGISDREERLSAVSRLPLAGPSAAVCKRVNSKVFSRLTADRLGITQPTGMVCRDLEELAIACAQTRAWSMAGRPIVFKDAFGVSGKGLVVIREPAKLDQVHSMITRRAGRRGDSRVGIVVEEWLPKRTDLNYQFTVGRDGSVRFDFVKEAIVEGNKHRGHRMPARLTKAQDGEIRVVAHALGEALAQEGYFGVVGVDALVTEDDRLYPVLEINARNNMSTYQERLRTRFFPGGQTALAKQYALRMRNRLSFEELRALLNGIQFRHGNGVLINSFATINAGELEPNGTRPGTFEGRLYALVVAGSDHSAEALDRELAHRLGTLADLPVAR